MQGSNNLFPKDIGQKKLRLKERLMTIIWMGMMNERTQWVAIGEMDKVGEL